MEKITNELEWISCEKPFVLAYHYHSTVKSDSLPFRWLTVDWGNKIHHMFEADNLVWFDAYAAWVTGTGPHPSKICPRNDFDPLDIVRGVQASVDCCAKNIRDDNSVLASACAASGASKLYPGYAPDPLDHINQHNKGAHSASALEIAWAVEPQEERRKAAHAYKTKVCQEFCDQFRDIAGNIFRPATILPEWRTSTVVELSQQINRELAFDIMPILADALQDAGCEDAQILEHCRGNRPHVRGCWLLELLVNEQAN